MLKQSLRQQVKIIAAVAAAREEAKLSQKELSLRISKSKTLMQKIESGQRGVAVGELIVIAKAIGIDPVELFRRTL
jgi:transcriptional regulator with XRE-family HTH domain